MQAELWRCEPIRDSKQYAPRMAGWDSSNPTRGQRSRGVLMGRGALAVALLPHKGRTPACS